MLAPGTEEFFLESLHDVKEPQMQRQSTRNPKLPIRLVSMAKIVANATCRSRKHADRLNGIGVCETFAVCRHPIVYGEFHG